VAKAQGLSGPANTRSFCIAGRVLENWTEDN